jgi:hypothetical protein
MLRLPRSPNLRQASIRPPDRPIGGRNCSAVSACRAILASMPLSLQHRHAVLLADRTRDVRTVTTVVTEVLAANAETTPLDIETALRAAAGQAYLVANSTTAGFEIVLGMPAWHAALADVGVTVEQNWAALSIRK